MIEQLHEDFKKYFTSFYADNCIPFHLIDEWFKNYQLVEDKQIEKEKPQEPTLHESMI